MDAALSGETALGAKPVPPRVPQVHVRFVVTHADASLQHRDRAVHVVVAVVPGALGEQPTRVGRGALAPLLGEERVPDQRAPRVRRR